MRIESAGLQVSFLREVKPGLVKYSCTVRTSVAKLRTQGRAGVGFVEAFGFVQPEPTVFLSSRPLFPNEKPSLGRIVSP